MPLTQQSAQAKSVREQYAGARDALEATNVRVAAVEDDLATLSGAERDARLKTYAQDSATRADVLTKMAALSDKAKAARAVQRLQGRRAGAVGA